MTGIIWMEESIPKKWKITHRLPNGIEVSYDVPALQIRDYDIDAIFEKKLLIMLPFYLFRFVNDFEEMEKDFEKRKVINEALDDISNRLDQLVEGGEISVYQQMTILDLLKRVSQRLTIEYKEVRKGVDEAMSGYIARTAADDILEQGELKQAKKTAFNMYNNGSTVEFISTCIGYDAAAVAEWLGIENKPAEDAVLV